MFIKFTLLTFKHKLIYVWCLLRDSHELRSYVLHLNKYEFHLILLSKLPEIYKIFIRINFYFLTHILLVTIVKVLYECL